MNRYMIVGIILLTLSAGIGGTYAVEHHGSWSKNSCVAGTGEQCMPDTFYQDYQHWLELHDAIVAWGQSAEVRKMQEKQDLADGIARRLSPTIPDGFQISREKMRFVLKTPPPAPQTQATPAAATSPAAALPSKK